MPGEHGIQVPMRFGVALLHTLVALAGLSFGQTGDPSLAQGLSLLEEGRTTLEEGSLNAAKEYLVRLTKEYPGDAIYVFHLARVEAYLVESHASHGDKGKAEQDLDNAIADALRSISLNDNSADAHSLLADLYGRRISLGGFLAGMRYGPKSSAENQKALALDPNSSRVHASLGRQYLHAPKMFGGDVDKAVASFRKATELDPKSDEAFVWLAIACRRKGDSSQADKALQEALRLNPRSAFARHSQTDH